MQLISKIISALSFSADVWMSILIGAVLTVIIAYIIYRIQKKEAGEHLQKHESRFDELKRMHEQDSEKIKVLYDLILQSQKGSIGEVEAAAIEDRIEAAAEQITEQDSDKALALKAIAEKQKKEADDLLDKISQHEHDLEELYNLRAMNEFRSGNYAETAVWLKKLMELKPHDMLLKVRFFSSLSLGGRFSEAESFCTEILTQLQSAPEPDEKYLTTWLHYMGNVKTSQQKIREAEEYLDQALEMGIRAYGSDSTELDTVYNDLGIIYMHTNQLDKAEAYLKTAQRLMKIETDQDLVNQAFNTCNIATVYTYQNRTEEAEKLFLEGIKTVVEHMGEYHPALTYYYNNLAYIYQNQNKLTEAENILQKAIDIFIQKNMTEHPGYMFPLSQFARVKASLGKYEEAETAYLKAVDIALKNYGAEHPLYARMVYSLALVYLQHDKPQEAEPLLLSTVEIEEKDSAITPASLGKTYQKLSESQLLQKKYTEAEQNLLKSAQLMTGNVEEEHTDMIANKQLLARLYQETGRQTAVPPEQD